MLVFNSPVYCLLPSFGRLSKSVSLNKMLQLFRGKGGLSHICCHRKCTIPVLRLWQTEFSFRGKVGYPTFHFFSFSFFFFFCLFAISIHISYVFSRKIGNLQGVKLLSGIPLPFIGTFRMFSAQKCCQILTILLEIKWGIHILQHFFC